MQSDIPNYTPRAEQVTQESLDGYLREKWQIEANASGISSGCWTGHPNISILIPLALPSLGIRVAVHLVTGISDHAQQTMAVLKSGKHCACTVPMATSLADIQAVIAAVDESRFIYMIMETNVYTRQFLYARRLKDHGDFGHIQFLRGAHYQDMEGLPPYWAGLPPMWYAANHAVALLLALVGSRATKVHCFGSGEMRERLRKPYGNPYPVETAIYQFFAPGLCAEVTRSLFHCGRPYMESFTVYGGKACHEWQMEGENPRLFRMSPVVDGQK